MVRDSLPPCRPSPPRRGKHVVVLGAGGAARAIAVELGLARASRITIVNRDRSRGEALSHLLQESVLVTSCYQPWDIPFTMPRDADILVNATSVGLYDADARIKCIWTRSPPIRSWPM